MLETLIKPRKNKDIRRYAKKNKSPHVLPRLSIIKWEIASKIGL